jgi:hypothetical protein
LDTQKDYTLEKPGTNKKTILMVLLLLMALSAPYIIVWHEHFFLKAKTILVDHFYLSLLSLLAGIVAHELIHAITWSAWAKDGIKAVRLGFDKKNFSPYCHLKVPVKLKYYILGALMPAIALGFIPYIFAWFTGSISAFLLGFVFTFGAASDIRICIKLRGLDLNTLVQDFPDKAGCYTVDK